MRLQSNVGSLQSASHDPRICPFFGPLAVAPVFGHFVHDRVQFRVQNRGQFLGQPQAS